MYSAPRVDKGSFRNFRPNNNNNPPQQNHNQSSGSSNLISNNASNYTSPSSMLSTNAMIRKQWKVGSKVEVYSSSKHKWYEGDITRIFIDSEGEWLEVQYACGKVMRLKQIPRDDKDAIRPLTKATPINRQKPMNNNTNNNNNSTYQGYKAPSGSLNMNNAKLSATATIGSSSGSNNNSGPTLTATATLTNNNNTMNNNMNNNNNNNDKTLEEMTQDDIDKQIRNSWVRGSRVEVYSRGRKKWMRGLVTRVFVDDEGEWLEVRYGKNLVKETPRDSPDIRPLRVRYKNRYKFTRDHENTVTAIWEEVDLENTRHLDRLLVSSVFRALNIDNTILKEGELDDVFKWIDKEDRGAVNIEEFISFMTNSVETIKQREIQQKMFKCIDRTASGKLTMSKTLKQEEQKKLAAIYKSHFNKSVKTKSPTLTSKFTPAPDKLANMGQLNLKTDENTQQQKKLLQELFKDDSKENNNNKNQQEEIIVKQDMGHDIIEAEPMDLDEMAEFSGGEFEDESTDKVSELQSQKNQSEEKELHSKLKDVGFSEKFLVATVASQKEEYHSKIKPEFSSSLNTNLQSELREIQSYMIERVGKAGVDGLRMSELGSAVHKKFRGFDRRTFLPSRKANFSDFVSLCSGLVVVEMEGSNKRMERIAVTDSCALKINLKSKLQFVLTMLFDKGKITNKLEPIKLERDKYGRIQKNRRLSVGERLITVSDFIDRIKSLGVTFDDGNLEGDELFWAVAGSNSTMISQKMVGRYFSSLIDHLSDPIEAEVAKVLPKVIDIARLRYRREPLWKKYIILRTICRWNNILYLRLTDRRTRSKYYDMIVIPRTASVHGGFNLNDVQTGFHYTCHILNKLQYPTICKKIDHGSDKFNFCCVTKTPHLRSFPEMLNESINLRNICYSEYFISQVIGCIFETILFCHKHDTCNFNLNIDSLGFDNNLRPILLDFSRSIVLCEDDKICRFFSIMSSTPPELALLMGSNNPLMNIELNGIVLRKADSWRCGVLLYTLITGRLPYHATSLGNFITQVLTLPPVIPIEDITWVSDELKDLLYKLLETTYFNRIDIKDALKHEWFKIISITTNLKQPTSLPTQIIDNIINLCKLENARNWISTITHKSQYKSDKQLDRDRKYFGRLDPTGQRKSLKKDKLCIFIMDRLGYCKYRAQQIIDEYNISADDDSQITWKIFVSTYIDIQWNDSDKLSQTKQFTNAIFRGLDPNGDGCVNSKLLLMLFEDINLKLQNIVNKLTTLQKFTFEQTVSTLADAFKNGFDIKDLLSVDHVVQSV